MLAPDSAAHTVTLVKAFVNPTKTLLAESQGNALSLPGGNWLIGYGGLPNFTEYDAAGHVLLDGTLGKDVQNFRTFLSPWGGQPASAPSRPGQAERLKRARRVGQLERSHAGRLLAGPRRVLAEPLVPVASGPQDRLSRRRCPCPVLHRTSPYRRSTPRALSSVSPPAAKALGRRHLRYSGSPACPAGLTSCSLVEPAPFGGLLGGDARR